MCRGFVRLLKARVTLWLVKVTLLVNVRIHSSDSLTAIPGASYYLANLMDATSVLHTSDDYYCLLQRDTGGGWCEA